jgi:ABC-type Fe3+ transport system substrate-binding protein
MQRLSRIIAFGYVAVCLLVLAATALVGPLGYAPFRLVRGPTRPPIVVTVWYGTEKKEWMEQAQRSFAETQPVAGGRPIEIRLRGMGSREMAERVAGRDWRGDTPPVALSPASSFWLDLAKAPVADAPQSLVRSPLVIVGWDERAKALWPSGPRDLWKELHDAINNPSGWKALGGNENWGPVKLGQTSPLTSNSGAQALMLMAYAFYGKTSGLTAADVANPDFQQWLREIESGVAGFGDSSGDLIADIVSRGPSQYDFGIIYENLALRSMEAANSRQRQPLRIFYPPATLLSDHPFVTLQGSWVTAEDRAAANQFRDFLLSRPMQELALRYGFRPVDQGVSIAASAADNPFSTYSANGVRLDDIGQVEVPPPDVVAALLELWRTQIGRG